MTETDSAVTEAARSVCANIKMDASKRIIRNLEPARPLRRLNVNQVPHSYSEMKPVEKPNNIIKVEHFYEILHLQSTSTQPSTQQSTQPSTQPSAAPSIQPRAAASIQPRAVPSIQPSAAPSIQPRAAPSIQPRAAASIQPRAVPSIQPKKKAERICYTRDFLIKLASCPMAKKKPEFLPEHPIVLDDGRTNDVPKYFINNNNNNYYYNNNEDSTV